LEGLSVSYYLRSANGYDTLMQMGRWFGYRSGYTDLCRIYTTGELLERYRFIATANWELWDMFDQMEFLGKSPDDFGFRVREFPGRLAITSIGKRRQATRIRVSFQGELCQTVNFDPKHSKHNFNALKRLIDDIGSEPQPIEDLKKPRIMWSKQLPETIIRFLEDYKTHDKAATIVQADKIAEYIKKQNVRNELTDWTIVIASNSDEGRVHTVDSLQFNGHHIGSVRRKYSTPPSDNNVSIGVLTNPSDQILDLTDDEKEKARKDTNRDREKRDKQPLGDNKLPNSRSIRANRPITRGLFLIYLVAYDDKKYEYGKEGKELVGFAISFPSSENAEGVDCLVNSVWQDELALEEDEDTH
jgi:hypothetical protein